MNTVSDVNAINAKESFALKGDYAKEHGKAFGLRLSYASEHSKAFRLWQSEAKDSCQRNISYSYNIYDYSNNKNLLIN